jgi:hypothetical protein
MLTFPVKRMSGRECSSLGGVRLSVPSGRKLNRRSSKGESLITCHAVKINGRPRQSKAWPVPMPVPPSATILTVCQETASSIASHAVLFSSNLKLKPPLQD